MIRNPEILEAFELAYARSQKPDFERNMALFEAMWEEACFLKVFPLKDPLEGMEVDLRIAQVINSV